jgi:glycosyltransferase involved in cell wall biosynthesis
MPRVSIILPTFNRARFLPEAFASIRQQRFLDWELIVVDDGSTDDTDAVVRELLQGLSQPVKFVKQENQGAYGARNTGVNHASGEFFAFFDSDDLWLPHHLDRSVAALDAAPDIDWVYAACRCVDAAGAVVAPTTFETDGVPRPFLSLHTRTLGDLRVIDDAGIVECQLTHGLYSGLQNAVIRREVFRTERFWPEYRVVEDVLFLVRALVKGLRVGYLKDIHVIYRIHEGNSSGSAAGASRGALYRVRRESVVGLERIRDEMVLTASQRRALQHALAAYYFWDIGYVCYLQEGDTAGAAAAFRKGLRLKPLDRRMWKTYLASIPRAWFRRFAEGASQPARFD